VKELQAGIRIGLIDTSCQYPNSCASPPQHQKDKSMAGSVVRGLTFFSRVGYYTVSIGKYRRFGEVLSSSSG
jgi:hypothetical protein